MGRVDVRVAGSWGVGEGGGCAWLWVRVRGWVAVGGAGGCGRVVGLVFVMILLTNHNDDAQIVGFIIGMISPFRRVLMDNNGPLHVIGDTGFMIGDAAIPCTTLILGANLLRGLKGSGIQSTTIIGIIVVRYIFLPLLGILIVKGAVFAGFVQSHDIFFQFVLLLQYSLPPAVSIGTVTELFGAGQNECSVIMLWTNVLAPVMLTLWCTFYLWLLS